MSFKVALYFDLFVMDVVHVVFRVTESVVHAAILLDNEVKFS